MKEDKMGGNTALLEGMRMNTKFWLENLKGTDHSEDIGIDGWILFERILEWWALLNTIIKLSGCIKDG
jgi:hypothetical protein